VFFVDFLKEEGDDVATPGWLNIRVDGGDIWHLLVGLI